MDDIQISKTSSVEFIVKGIPEDNINSNETLYNKQNKLIKQ